MRNIIDRRGYVSGRLTVVDYVGDRKWVCRCECGNTVVVRAENLVSKHTKSCGCLNKETMSKIATTHGLSPHSSPETRKEYASWSGLIGRCYNLRNKKYPSYGGRGITVCREWRDSFVTFLTDMGKAPTPIHTVGRIDNDGDYEPSNCRWETPLQQGRNKRNNIFLEFEGRKFTIAEWAKVVGIGRRTLTQRYRSGWAIKDILTVSPIIGSNQFNLDKKVALGILA